MPTRTSTFLTSPFPHERGAPSKSEISPFQPRTTQPPPPPPQTYRLLPADASVRIPGISSRHGTIPPLVAGQAKKLLRVIRDFVVKNPPKTPNNPRHEFTTHHAETIGAPLSSSPLRRFAVQILYELPSYHSTVSRWRAMSPALLKRSRIRVSRSPRMMSLTTLGWAA